MSTISQDCGYPDPNCAPSSPDAAVVSRMCRTLLNPLGVALESALVSLVPEDDGKLRYEPAAASPPAGSASCDRKQTKLGHTSEGESSGEAGDDEEGRFSSQIDDKMTNEILAAFGNAVSATDWHGVAGKDIRHSTPPAALLRGNMQHYQRLGAKWRIVARDVEIRPRVALDEERGEGEHSHRKRKRTDRQSLWDKSIEAEALFNGRTNQGAGGVSNQTSGSRADATTDSAQEGFAATGVGSGTVKIAGEVVILAYGDD